MSLMIRGWRSPGRGSASRGRAVVVAALIGVALVIAGCYRGDLECIRAGLRDVLIEPLRAPLVRGFEPVKAAALAHGALGASISGGGPSVFAWLIVRLTQRYLDRHL